MMSCSQLIENLYTFYFNALVSTLAYFVIQSSPSKADTLGTSSDCLP